MKVVRPMQVVMAMTMIEPNVHLHNPITYAEGFENLIVFITVRELFIKLLRKTPCKYFNGYCIRANYFQFKAILQHMI